MLAALAHIRIEDLVGNALEFDKAVAWGNGVDAWALAAPSAFGR